MGRLMKDSGIEWCLEIPFNWQVMPNKRIMHKVKDICEKYDGENILSLTMNGVIIRDLDAGGKMPTSFDGYQRVVSGNLLMCLFDIDVTPRCIGLICNNGLTSPAYSQFELKSNAYAPYYYYYYLMLDNTKELLHLAKNLRHSFTEEQLGGIITPVPPYAEQRKIADFLDKKCREVDELIALEEKMIAELKAYKQSVITETVTKGLNPDVPMKDSGIEWIGQIPAHWEIRRLKNRATQIFKGNGITKEDIVENGDSPCVRYGEIYSKYNYYFEHCITKTNKSRVASKQYFSYGDLLFAGTGELVEEIGKAIVYLGNEECLAGGDIIILKHNENPLYLSYALNCQHAQAQKSCSKAKLKVVHISADDIANIMTVFPPIEEQTAIAGFLLDICMSIDSLISIKQSKIAELQDYKKSIIYEYATGKKEVPTL